MLAASRIKHNTMNKKILIVILSVLSLTSCKDYSDLHLIGKNDKIDIIKSVIDVALVGSEQIDGTLEIKFKEETIGQGEITSHFDVEFKEIEIDFSKIESETNSIISSIKGDNEIELILLFINEKEKIKLEKKISLKTVIPPVSNVFEIKGEKFEKNHNSSEALISEIIKNKSRILEFSNQTYSLNVLQKSDEIKIKLSVDTVYNKSFIWRYPVKTNNFYSNLDIEKNLLEDINNNDANLKTEYTGEIVNGNYIISDEYKVGDEKGEIGLYLINIDDSENYFIQQIGSYLTDGVSPNFSNSSYCSFNGNPKIEGQVCLDTKHFYGYNPYNVPFVGRAYGDVSKIIVDNMNVKFEIGKEIYFKKRIYLDGGYNRVPVKIIDKNGNITESYISITIE
jgi:hypothetical protein